MIGFGIVGTGGMAAAMAHAIRLSGEARVAAILSATAGRAAGFAAQHGGQAVADMAAMLADPGVDAVYVANRNREHASAAIAALEAGKAVLCEKPFACSMRDAEAVIAAAAASGRPFVEAVATPFLPAVAEAMRRAAAGEYGAVRGVSASFGYPVDAAAFPTLFAADAGALLDRGVYPLTLARLILGPVVDVRSEGSEAKTVRLHMRHQAGGRSDLSVSMIERLPNRLTIACEHGDVGVAPPLLKAQRLTVGIPSDRFAQHPLARRLMDAAARWTGRWFPYGETPYLPELRHFCDMVRGGRRESAVLPHAVMLDVQRIIAEARAGL